MSKSIEPILEQIKLSLSDYQSKLNEIDTETDQEKKRIIDAIKAEENEIESLLSKYRDIKRQKELEIVKSSYDNVANFKKTLLLKIQSEAQGISYVEQDTELVSISAQDTNQLTDNQAKSPEVNQKIKVVELIQLIEGMTAQDLVKLYPADIDSMVSSFEVENTDVKDGALEYYQERNPDIYNAILKIYQKPYLAGKVAVPDVAELSSKDREYHDFLQANYPKAIPFFWFLINREQDSIRYIVMEFAIDHIVHSNTLDDDPNRQELSLDLNDLLAMNYQQIHVKDFLRDIYLCFHPKRVSQKSNSKNKYFDYVNSLIKDQSSLEQSEILQIWNHMNKVGYSEVTSPNFKIDRTANNSKDSSFVNTNKEDLL